MGVRDWRLGVGLGRTLRGLAAALSLSALLVGCGKGGEGEPCNASCSGGILGGCAYSCDPGLPCDRTSSSYTCRKAQSVGVGGACANYGDPLCAAGLYCNFIGRYVCLPAPVAGQICGADAGVSCGETLNCCPTCDELRCAGPGAPGKCPEVSCRDGGVSDGGDGGR